MQDTFFSILRSIIWGTELQLPASIKWQDVFRLAAYQKCQHAFSVWLKTHSIVTPFDKQLYPSIFLVLQRQARLNHLTTNVVQLLEQQDMPATLIKGYSLSCLYPDPDTRDFGDIDIYVGEQHYHRAAQLITEAFPSAHWHSDIRGGIHFILVIDENQDRVVELHRVTMEFHDSQANALYQAFTHKYLSIHSSFISIGDIQVPVPSVAYNALYVFMHAWHHFESTGVGFRQLADWALALNSAHKQLSAQEWKDLVEEIQHILSALHMTVVWQTFGHLLVDQLHLSSEAFPLYTTRYKARAKRLLRQLLRDGHGARPSKCNLSDITLMRCFPYERPANNRFLQRVYTACRMFFDACQLVKFFPDFAWYDLKASVQKVFTRSNIR